MRFLDTVPCGWRTRWVRHRYSKASSAWPSTSPGSAAPGRSAVQAGAPRAGCPLARRGPAGMPTQWPRSLVHHPPTLRPGAPPRPAFAWASLPGDTPPARPAAYLSRALGITESFVHGRPRVAARRENGEGVVGVNS